MRTNLLNIYFFLRTRDQVARLLGAYAEPIAVPKGHRNASLLDGATADAQTDGSDLRDSMCAGRSQEVAVPPVYRDRRGSFQPVEMPDRMAEARRQGAASPPLDKGEPPPEDPSGVPCPLPTTLPYLNTSSPRPACSGARQGPEALLWHDGERGAGATVPGGLLNGDRGLEGHEFRGELARICVESGSPRLTLLATACRWRARRTAAPARYPSSRSQGAPHRCE